METLYIRLEKPPKGANHARIGGRIAAKNWKKLTAIALEMNAKPLEHFLGTESADGKGVWFRPSEALVTIRKLISSISSNKREYENPRQLIQDLNTYENILTSADARSSKFQFAADSPPNYPPSED